MGVSAARVSQSPLVNTRAVAAGAQEFCVQIDSHVDFVPDFDAKMIDIWRMTENEYGILTTYSPEVDSIDRPQGPSYSVPLVCDMHFTDEKMPRNGGGKYGGTVRDDCMAGHWRPSAFADATRACACVHVRAVRQVPAQAQDELHVAGWLQVRARRAPAPCKHGRHCVVTRRIVLAAAARPALASAIRSDASPTIRSLRRSSTARCAARARQVNGFAHIEHAPAAAQEYTRAARLWTHGYDFYAPHRNTIFHDYNLTLAKKAKAWTFNLAQSTRAHDRLKTLMRMQGRYALRRAHTRTCCDVARRIVPSSRGCSAQ